MRWLRLIHCGFPTLNIVVINSFETLVHIRNVRLYIPEDDYFITTAVRTSLLLNALNAVLQAAVALFIRCTSLVFISTFLCICFATQYKAVSCYSSKFATLGNVLLI